jgi:hypothetical protein
MCVDSRGRVSLTPRGVVELKSLQAIVDRIVEIVQLTRDLR